MDKLKANSKQKYADVLSITKFFKDMDVVPTNVPMINVALSGKLGGGLTAGLTVLAGPSKHFKTSFALLIASAYLRKHKDAVILFYDSEFGSPQSYFNTFGIDLDRVFHTPIKNIEELKFDLVSQLENIERKDKVIVVIDSVGNLASLKEVEDAKDSKSVADMTRAKQLKSVFRIITPYLTELDIPMLAINHTYDTQEMYSRKVVSGGTGIYYSADTIWIIGRQKDKDGTDIAGYDFIINMEKSRFLREGTKIPISVSWEGGVKQFSGLLDIAVAGQFVHKGKKGRSNGYSYMNVETGEVDDSKVYYEKETHSYDFWKPILENEKFQDFVESQYLLGKTPIINDNEFLNEIVDEEENAA